MAGRVARRKRAEVRNCRKHGDPTREGRCGCIGLRCLLAGSRFSQLSGKAPPAGLEATGDDTSPYEDCCFRSVSFICGIGPAGQIPHDESPHRSFLAGQRTPCFERSSNCGKLGPLSPTRPVNANPHRLVPSQRHFSLRANSLSVLMLAACYHAVCFLLTKSNGPIWFG